MSHPNATSKIIIMTKQIANPIVPKSECFPLLILLKIFLNPVGFNLFYYSNLSKIIKPYM